MLDKIKTIEALIQPLEVNVFKLTDVWRDDHTEISAKATELALLIDEKHYDLTAEFTFHVLAAHPTKPLGLASIQDFDVTCDLSGASHSMYVTERAKEHILKYIIDSLCYHSVPQFSMTKRSPLYPIALHKSCSLGASGFTNTLDGVYEWCQRTANDVRESLGSENLKASLFPYREQDYEMICFNIHHEFSGFYYDIEFILDSDHDYSPPDRGQLIGVPDAIEALHIIGILKAELGICISSIGRQGNEINPRCIPHSEDKSRTNGKLKLFLLPCDYQTGHSNDK